MAVTELRVAVGRRCAASMATEPPRPPRPSGCGVNPPSRSSTAPVRHLSLSAKGLPVSTSYRSSGPTAQSAIGRSRLTVSDGALARVSISSLER